MIEDRPSSDHVIAFVHVPDEGNNNGGFYPLLFHCGS